MLTSLDVWCWVCQWRRYGCAYCTRGVTLSSRNCDGAPPIHDSIPIVPPAPTTSFTGAAAGLLLARNQPALQGSVAGQTGESPHQVTPTLVTPLVFVHIWIRLLLFITDILYTTNHLCIIKNIHTSPLPQRASNLKSLSYMHILEPMWSGVNQPTSMSLECGRKTVPGGKPHKQRENMQIPCR